MKEIFIKNIQYTALENNIITLLHEIEKHIGNDGYELLDKLDSMYNQREAIIINLCETCQKRMA
ncbi:hypothetical protein [Clostridium beijerinckii]|uniref:Uncharacterized protein n=1 Tax=Clostridium beijerinckii TaxID=1520 RepID=A0AAW3WG90_CLOBE|nr:hypothetical protein [Clostridium beijerinckii]MBC2460397.1 hypothetical protein [Clostridium beijerinckii]MBC2477874.1 hypothetical protein [Clostridium beijerinckii]NOV63571.1 hypothetical protein [Clostridium beijerinckii]NOV73430.1 hypothetical protein [Clostridium beijerinckii]NOW35455.1 hypothetical protein [Clostridium beijerinckii]